MNKLGFLRLPKRGEDYDWELLSQMVDKFMAQGGTYFDTCYTYLSIRPIIVGKTAIGCTGCRYCEPHCPMKLPIPDLFRLYNEIMREPEEDWKIQPNYLQVSENDERVVLSTDVLFGVQSVYMKEDGLTGMYYDYAMAAPLMVPDKEPEDLDVLIQDEVAYYKEIYRRDGLQGLISQLG